MADTVKLNIWLPEYKRKEFILVHKNILEKYEQITQLVFYSIEETTEKYGNELVEKYEKMYDYETMDPSDIFEKISYEKYEYYQMEKLIEYNVSLGILSTAYQILEQQLRKFIYEELNQSFSPVRTDDFVKVGINMWEIKELYKVAGYDLETCSYWDDISILADIVNTFKHGKGRSSERLYKNNPNLFLKSYFSKEKIIDQELTSNSAIVLDLDQIDFKYYLYTIINFWNQFPEHINGTYTFVN